ncbi:MAG: GSU3473 family protein [Nitrospirota bacterium]
MILIRVIYQNGKFDMVKPFMLEKLISSKKVRKFLRSGGWATVGVDSIRGMDVGFYRGPERRQSSIST